MPSQSPNLNLTLYDRTSDTGSTFLDFRDQLAGTGTSNMVKIDIAVQDVLNELDSVKGVGYTNQTVKGNYDDNQLNKQRIVYPAIVTGTNTLTATIPELTSVQNNLPIILIPSAKNTSAVTLNINSYGGLPVVKTSSISGTTVYTSLEAGDLQVNMPMLVVKDSSGSRYLISNFGEDFARNSFYDYGNGIYETVQSLLTSILAEINTPQSTTITLDKTTQITKVTDAYSGIADLVLKGDTLFNAVVNGNFTNGATGWDANSSTSTIVVDTDSFNIAGTGAQFQALANTTTAVNVKAGAKYFLKLKGKVTNAVCQGMFVSLGGIDRVGEVLNPVNGQQYDVFGVITATTNRPYAIAIGHRYIDAATANGKIMEVDRNTGVFVIPITGTPYENMTATEINNKIGSYFEGLKGATLETVGSRGKNLFDKNAVVLGADLFEATGLVGTVAGRRVSAFIRVKPSTGYHARYVIRLCYYDNNKQFISGVALGGIDYALTTPVNCAFIRTSHFDNGDDIQVEAGVVLTAREPFDGSQVAISAVRHKLPNLIADSLEFVDGRWLYYKRTAEYVLLSADLTTLTTTNTSLDTVNVDRGRLIGIKAQLAGLTTADAKLAIGGFAPNGAVTTVMVDTSAQIGTYVDTASYSAAVLLIVAKGTYANLAAAQTALAGTKVVYQLATPLVIEEKDFSAHNITIDGSLSANNGITEFYVSDYDILADALVTYPQNIAAAVESLKESVDGIKEKMGDWLTDDPWIAPTLLNGWVNFGGVSATAGYYKDDFGVVHLRGCIKLGAIPSVIFNLPIGHRILKYITYVTASGISSCQINILTDNTVYVASGTSASVFLDGISFKAEA